MHKKILYIYKKCYELLEKDLYCFFCSYSKDIAALIPKSGNNFLEKVLYQFFYSDSSKNIAILILRSKDDFFKKIFYCFLYNNYSKNIAIFISRLRDDIKDDVSILII